MSLPIYSGGLGALAGDILKEASDMALPLVAVGLLYRNGYFRQRIDANGWQHEYWVDTDPDRLPAALVTHDDGTPVTVTVPIRDIEVIAQIWRVDVGRVPLYLLDAERPENSSVARWITSRLYISDPDMRLAQYMLLGVGGVQALAALGIEPGIVHLNEGHAAFVTLEMARRATSGDGNLEAALSTARGRTVFTTHTPVPAGNDTYPAQQVEETLGPLAGALGVSAAEIVRARAHAPAEDGRAVRRHPVRAAHEPHGQRRLAPPRRGGARDVARHVARPRRRRRADHPRHQRRPPADLARPADAVAARPPPRRGLADPGRRPRDLGAGGRTSPRPSCGACAASSAPS